MKRFIVFAFAILVGLSANAQLIDVEYTDRAQVVFESPRCSCTYFQDEYCVSFISSNSLDPMFVLRLGEDRVTAANTLFMLVAIIPTLRVGDFVDFTIEATNQRCHYKKDKQYQGYFYDEAYLGHGWLNESELKTIATALASFKPEPLKYK